MKGFLRFGMPRHQRYSMQYGYDARPSLWHKVTANAHLIIAGIGTASLLGIAGIALWLAMPTGDRQAFAQGAKIGDHAKPVIVADNAPIAADAAKAVLPEQKPVTPAANPTTGASSTRQAGDNSASQNAAASPALTTTQPASQTVEQAFVAPKIDPVAAAAIAVTEEATGQKTDSGNADGAQDGAKTAAISPTAPDAPDTEAQDSGKTGYISRTVTMRAGPKKGAAVLATIPAKTKVEIMSCTKWCEVVYKGKRGWIYKSFVKHDS